MDATFSRKAFLKILGLVGLVGPTVLVSGCGSSGGGGGGGGGPQVKVAAFKLSRRGESSCNACIAHARNKVFQSAAAADQHRAHVGCNCKVKVVQISQDDSGSYFAKGPVFDRRSKGRG